MICFKIFYVSILIYEETNIGYEQFLFFNCLLNESVYRDARGIFMYGFVINNR